MGAGDIEQALQGADDTRIIETGEGVIEQVAAAFSRSFGDRPAIVIADETTRAVAGDAVADLLARAGVSCHRLTLPSSEAIPVAVGSGTINDIVKLASHESQRPYMVVGTAASMDGYTAFGASIARDGYKQTFSCPAPAAVIADTRIVAAAPRALTASGYADLLAKVTAGADWLLADALGVEPVHEQAWQLVQEHLRDWTARPDAVAAGDIDAVTDLSNGLLIVGLAMQAYRNSRPASGAEHQFSHLWEMEHLQHPGTWLSHGFKVGIGTIAVATMYEGFLELDLSAADPAQLVSSRPGRAEVERAIRLQEGPQFLLDKRVEETLAKYPDDATLQKRLERLIGGWPSLQTRLHAQLLPAREIRDRLRRAGCPWRASDIGLSRDRLQRSFPGARQIRRRYTVLDAAAETGSFSSLSDSAVSSMALQGAG